ncbi:P-loop containing nucleoside triphosphate hydrolase protein [Baffinella frigidus]|nr:P-loop containing nucleoside triphosphate hydrolase protein [Cryptophyta sp. CCMP2293]
MYRGRVFSLKNHCMSGATLPQLLVILWNNRSDIHWGTYSVRITFLFLMSLFNSFIAVIEWLLFSRAVARQELNARPIFILGHPRTGTTLIHNILAQDKALSYASLLAVAFPAAFISLFHFRWMLAGLVDKTRPMDAMPLHLDLPGEDELATTLISGGMPLFFMHKYAQYFPLLTLEGDGPEVRAWEQAFLHFLKKVTYATGGAGRRLVIKSPVHTSRVPHLLRLFPDAQFIYVHRDPRVVLQSSLHMAQSYYWYTYLAVPSDAQISGFVVQQMEVIYRAYFASRSLIPKGNLVEVAFADLEKDLGGELRRIYSTLNLSPISPSEGARAAGKYEASTEGFKKNSHLSRGMQELLRGRLAFVSQHQGYPLPLSEEEQGSPLPASEHGFSAEPVPASAYVGSSKNLKDLKDR